MLGLLDGVGQLFVGVLVRAPGFHRLIDGNNNDDDDDTMKGRTVALTCVLLLWMVTVTERGENKQAAQESNRKGAAKAREWQRCAMAGREYSACAYNLRRNF